MKNYILRSGAGKTLRMVALSEFESAPIICSDDVSRKRIVQLARKYDYRIPFPVTAKELIAGKLFNSTIHNRFLVDESQDVLSAIVSGLTHPGEECLIGMTTSDERFASQGESGSAIAKQGG